MIRNRRWFNRTLSGSMTVEMSILFPIILIVILSIMMFVFYINDIICVRAASQKYGIIYNIDEKSESEIYKEYLDNIKSNIIIAKIRDVEIKKYDEKTNINTILSFEMPIFNIRKVDDINVTMYNKNNRLFIVRSKALIDSID